VLQAILVHFRKRIGKEGVEKILKHSIELHGKDGQDKHTSIDTTVQEKNITYPTDSKLHKRIIDKCVGIAKKREPYFAKKLLSHSKRISSGYLQWATSKTEEEGLFSEAKIKDNCRKSGSRTGAKRNKFKIR